MKKHTKFRTFAEYSLIIITAIYVAGSLVEQEWNPAEWQRSVAGVEFLLLLFCEFAAYEMTVNAPVGGYSRDDDDDYIDRFFA